MRFFNSANNHIFEGTTDEAIQEAKQILREDPELGHVEVYQEGTYIGQATHVPDLDWQSVVGWLWAGEQVVPPAGFPSIHDGEGYALDDPKHPTYHERMSDLADLRD
jgi:hypothetical protein